MAAAKKLKIKKGDKVIVLAGKDKGKTGDVLQVLPSVSKVKVSGVNIIKKHTKPSHTSAGGIIEMEALIHVSNVSLIDPKSSNPTRVGVKILKDGKKVRVAKKSGEVIDS